MARQDNPYKGYLCPLCRERDIETVVTVPRIRGYLLAYQMSTLKAPCCRQCARREMLAEAGRSLFLGWFSISALIVNPLFILWNVVRVPFVGANYAAVKKLFAEAGIPEPSAQPDIMRVLYGLAAAMIAADGEIDPAEVETALTFGDRVSPDFDPGAFHDTVEKHAELPSPDAYATVLAQSLTADQKQLVVRYLAIIAFADGEFSSSEETLLKSVAAKMEVAPSVVTAAIFEAQHLGDGQTTEAGTETGSDAAGHSPATQTPGAA